ncbi:HSP70/90 co-chaperone [Linderina pennispora]|nr:HSP70/90 co-chaperone [Linderina pennispora]
MSDNDQASAGPAPASKVHGKSWDEIEQDLNKLPFFMRDLNTDDDEENPALEALKTLAYDGPPEEIAENFKSQGNDCFKAGQYKDALDFYTKGLAPEHYNIDLKVSLLTNRAATNLHLKNYGKVLRDCSEALRLRPKSTKALFRSAKACLALGKYEEALECCKWGLGIDETNREIAVLQKQVEKTKAEHERKIKEKEERERKLAEKRQKLKQAIEIRKLQFDTTRKLKPEDSDSDSDSDEEKAKKKPAPYAWENDSGRQVSLDEESGHLFWPVFFLYPEFKESDFVQDFDEALTIGDMLGEVLAQSPPWDTEHKYTIDNVDTYFLHRPVGGFDEDERLVKVGMGTRLGAAIGHQKYIIRDGIPNFVVLPRGAQFTEEFIDRYRKLRAQNEAAKTTSRTPAK